MRPLSIAATLLAPVLLAAVPAAHERRFPAAGFDAITLSSSDRMIVTAGSAASVVATGDPVAVAALRIAVRGATLYVDRLPGSYRDRGATITVTLPRLEKVTLEGSGSIIARRMTGSRFAAEDSGSGSIAIEDLRAAETRLQLSGSGSITAAGTAPQLWIDASGSGSVDTTHLGARDIDVIATGSSSVRAHAARRATIRSSGSGSVGVDGATDCRVSKSGSGPVRCRQVS